MLEECGVRVGRDWEALPVNIGTGGQFSAEFLAVSPNNRITAIVDAEGKPITGGKEREILFGKTQSQQR